ncbi:MAG: helix-turn-helix transcriptional regulator [Lachnospiraceae bacterium]|nr:helix-turn-helix transcriptional regulator [Lachnospiraceae bacterium]
MKHIQSIAFHPGSKEELLPGFTAEFPYIATRAELNKYAEQFVPWHWHRAAELFYMESGALEYCTPGGRTLFPEGSGGMVISNVLHMTKLADSKKNVQFLHIFDPALLAGGPDSRIKEKYIEPLLESSQIELIPLFPEDPKQEKIITCIRKTFELSPDVFGYEIRLRNSLSELWLMLLEQARLLPKNRKKNGRDNDKIKQMMIYIHEHYPEKISVKTLAASAFISERECFRVFQDCLHLTPLEYLTNYRLQTAYQMLAKSHETITEISHACGLGSGSYFGKIFREHANCTPSEYRQKWQDRDR